MASGDGSLARIALGTGFVRGFFFSVETFSTVGYGQISPRGLPANIVVTLEILSGLMGLTLATGMLFARIARPTARIIFSRRAVIAPYQNITLISATTPNVPIPALDRPSSMKKIVSTMIVGVTMFCCGAFTPLT